MDYKVYDKWFEDYSIVLNTQVLSYYEDNQLNKAMSLLEDLQQEIPSFLY